MKVENRKTPRFFIINPVTDRRMECRFESLETVDIRDEETGKTISGVASDIGRRGLKLESPTHLLVGNTIQVAFQDDIENVRCFGHVAWSKRKEDSSDYESGLQIDSWHGIILGPDSWKKFKGVKVKRDRRRKLR